MTKESAKNGDANRLVSKEELKMEDSKLVSRIEKLQT